MAEVEHVAERGRGRPPWVASVPAEPAAMLQPMETENQKEQMLSYLVDRVMVAATTRLEAHGVDAGRIRVVFKNGQAVRRILKTIREEGADLVVTGSRGLSDLAGAVEGRVSHRIAHLAPRTVITVK